MAFTPTQFGYLFQLSVLGIFLMCCDWLMGFLLDLSVRVELAASMYLQVEQLCVWVLAGGRNLPCGYRKPPRWGS